MKFAKRMAAAVLEYDADIYLRSFVKYKPLKKLLKKIAEEEARRFEEELRQNDLEQLQGVDEQPQPPQATLDGTSLPPSPCSSSANQVDKVDEALCVDVCSICQAPLRSSPALRARGA